MECWECGKEGTVQFDMKKAEYFMGEHLGNTAVSQRWYCKSCCESVTSERECDRERYIKLKKKLMYERAVRMLERQTDDLYYYKEALEAVKSFSLENPDKFDSAHEMVAAAILISNEIPVKMQYKVAGYRVDFFIPCLKTVLEVDGAFHKMTVSRDSKRDIAIRNELGHDFEIIRISTKYIEDSAELLVEALRTIWAERQKIRKQNHGQLPEWYRKK